MTKNKSMIIISLLLLSPIFFLKGQGASGIYTGLAYLSLALALIIHSTAKQHQFWKIFDIIIALLFLIYSYIYFTA